MTSASTLPTQGRPDSWLGAARARYANEVPLEDEETEQWQTFVGRGPLRGVERICLHRLQKALACEVLDLGNHGYLVRTKDGAEEEGVQTTDAHIDRCHCADFLYRSESLKTPCKHLLAALLFEGHPHLVALAETLTQRNAVAAAVTKRVPKAPPEDASALDLRNF